MSIRNKPCSKSISGRNWGQTFQRPHLHSKITNLVSFQSLPTDNCRIISHYISYTVDMSLYKHKSNKLYGDTLKMIRKCFKHIQYRISVAKSEGKRPLGRPRHRWVDHIKMDLREKGWGGMDCIGTNGGLLLTQ
jgi:hypothetical protein